MVNKDKTGTNRQARLREERAKWLMENAYGLSAEGLIGALMRGECFLTWNVAPKVEKKKHGKRISKHTKR